MAGAFPQFGKPSSGHRGAWPLASFFDSLLLGRSWRNSGKVGIMSPGLPIDKGERGFGAENTYRTRGAAVANV
jgi:hypothetical protein